MRFDDQRKRLVEELVQYGIRDEKVLKAFETVPRENFVLPQYVDFSYRNQPLPIDFNQTISQPLMIAIMLEHLELSSDDTVLEIGTGSGYQTSLLATIVKEVCTIERIEGLSIKARPILKNLGFSNIYFRIGDGSSGWQKAYPVYKEFPKIIVSAAASKIPDKLIEQLADPGLFVIPVGGSQIQDLIKVRKTNGQILQTVHGGCTFVPLISEGQ
jgi:protein-L-isoaspartate(D-aspartate) O-methyltransferase